MVDSQTMNGSNVKKTGVAYLFSFYMLVWRLGVLKIRFFSDNWQTFGNGHAMYITLKEFLLKWKSGENLHLWKLDEGLCSGLKEAALTNCLLPYSMYDQRLPGPKFP